MREFVKTIKPTRRYFKPEILIPLGLVFVLAVFLLPMLAGWLGTFFDDYYEVLPRLYNNARSVQKGAFPLWDPHVFAGGRINFIPNTRIWYWPLYPFYFLADLDNIDSSYAWLIKIPLAAQWLICLLAAYGFAYKAVRLQTPAAALAAIVYAFGASYTGNSSDPQTIYSFVWIPLALWGIVAYARDGNKLMGIIAAFSLAFIGPCGTDVRAIFSLLTVALTIGLVSAFFFLHRSPVKARRLLVAGVVIFILGLLLSGPYWASMKESIAIYRDSTMVSFSRAASSESSTPWSFLITLLVPDLFGTVTAGSSVDLGLPEIHSYWHVEGNLTGGYWLLLLCFLGSVVFWRNHYNYRSAPDKTDETRRVWWWAGLSLFVFSLLLVTGRYSPLYRGLVRLIPVFGLPYAVRWRIMEHLGIALLAGISSQALLDNRRSLSRCLLASLMVLTFIGAAWQMNRTGSHGLLVLQRVWANHRTWLIASPGLYLAWVLGGTAVLIFLVGRSWRGKIIIAAAALESVLIGFSMTYFLAFRCPDIGDTRYRSPRDTALYRQSDYPFLTNLPAPRTGPERTTFYNSMVDHMAALHGGEYLMGYCSKPLAPRLRDALTEVTEGYPYELIIEKPGARFFPNMSVRHMVLEEPDLLPEQYAAMTELPNNKLPGELYDYRLRFTIPRVYLQNRIILCSPAQARYELINGDLRAGAFLEDRKHLPLSIQRSLPLETGEGNRLQVTDYRSFNPGSEDWGIKHFDNLQGNNKISRVWFSNPNRMDINVKVKTLGMLITTDVFYPGWEVKVDGEKKPVVPVNYIQRGVWLSKGNHLVEWVFRPAAVKEGFIYLGLGLLTIVVLMILPASGFNKEDS
ncbi:MAG: hypothetical protein RAO92_09415 [Candidatus Euphemobacter frigidus]|nr:hypothetical protein [Candidatus Euphemobacter frigidus]MDP8276600.1 hypothetical protein [Candidatus Euphemobacter frigidus]